MINVLSAFHWEEHPMRLNREFHLDLSGWLEFFQSWNGYSFLLSPRWAPLPDLHVSSNAAGSVGYGAILVRDWFAGRDGLHNRCPYPLPTKNAFRLSWQLLCVVISGPQSRWNSVLTIQQWSRCCGPIRHEIRTWWCCFVTSPCWWPGTPSHLLLVMFLENQME